MLNALFINGHWQKPVEPGTIGVFNPCTEENYHVVANAGPADVDKAVAAAKAALPGWKRAGGAVRERFLRAISARFKERAEELARLSSRNNGKPLAEARIDMADAAAPIVPSNFPPLRLRPLSCCGACRCIWLIQWQ